MEILGCSKNPKVNVEFCFLQVRLFLLQFSCCSNFFLSLPSQVLTNLTLQHLFPKMIVQFRVSAMMIGTSPREFSMHLLQGSPDHLGVQPSSKPCGNLKCVDSSWGNILQVPQIFSWRSKIFCQKSDGQGFELTRRSLVLTPTLFCCSSREKKEVVWLPTISAIPWQWKIDKVNFP